MTESLRFISVSMFVASTIVAAEEGPYRAQGELCGEVTERTALLQTRLTETPGLNSEGDIKGVRGVACFEYDVDPKFPNPQHSEWFAAEPSRDHIVRTRLTKLLPGTRYYYRALTGFSREEAKPGATRSFSTLPGRDRSAEISFCVGSCMLYDAFVNGIPSRGKEPAPEPDRKLGYPSFAAMTKLEPDFFVGTGDIVYYDFPRTKESPAAQTLPQMRKKWHEQFRFPRLVEFFANTSTYWSKDDHDFRYDDADLTGERLPLPTIGIDLFREQLPIAPPGDVTTPTYRTHRISKHLQIWLSEGRDHRSPNRMKDGPEKSLWGKTQREWLQRTLAESDATWKILISPTPMVGPDDATKIDNHTNWKGFRHEGESFFKWLKDHRISGFLTVCGDRHWQFHSIHPSGVEEFGCGALNDENARGGRRPGDPRSTDPDRLIRQPFKYPKATGGFLHLISREDGALRIEFRDDLGELLYAVDKKI